jgi:hypothetical protein
MSFRSSFALIIVFSGKWLLTQYGVYGANKLWDESDLWFENDNSYWQKQLIAFDEVIINYFQFLHLFFWIKSEFFFIIFFFKVKFETFRGFETILEFVIKTISKPLRIDNKKLAFKRLVISINLFYYFSNVL